MVDIPRYTDNWLKSGSLVIIAKFGHYNLLCIIIRLSLLGQKNVPETSHGLRIITNGSVSFRTDL